MRIRSSELNRPCPSNSSNCPRQGVVTLSAVALVARLIFAHPRADSHCFSLAIAPQTQCYTQDLRSTPAGLLQA